MDLIVKYPDLNLSDVLITVDTEMTVGELAQQAVEEWNLNGCYFDLTFEGNVMKDNSTIVSYGCSSGDELIAAQRHGILTCRLEQLMNSDWVRSLETPINDVTLHIDCSQNGTFLSSDMHLPSFPLSSVVFRNARGITSIDSFTLSKISVDFVDGSDFTSVTELGGYFLHETAVRSVNLSGLVNVNTVGKRFMSECENLTTLDLSWMINVVSIEEYFLHRCTALVTLSVPASKLSIIGSDFLSSCTSLAHLDMASCKSVSQIGKYFCYLCPLKSLDFTSPQAIWKCEPDDNVTKVMKTRLNLREEEKKAIKEIIPNTIIKPLTRPEKGDGCCLIS
eukprot:TRINITY_DN2145_c5_g1_i1.p1 TRINITY_DN2145_c5_g1~~TRINITY_DN2145_c5_g1_i1.p1  ORF type:complete len:335 (+),score=55.11 TRINITY_DN2145_c5_g1_i1:98-1102(+)